MTISIGFLNFGAHKHVLDRIYRFCIGREVEIILFSTKDVSRKLSEEGIEPDERFLQRDGENLYSYLCRIEPVCSHRLDFLINVGMYTNIRRYLSLLTFNPDCIRLLLTNEANGWAGSGFSFSRDFSFQYNLWANAKLPLKRKILKQYTAILVEFDTIQEYMKEELNCMQPVHVVNTVIKKETMIGPDEDRIRFVIPGNISKSRRNYEMALSAFEDAFEQYPNKIELCLLGRLKDKSISNRCDDLISSGYCVDYYENWVPSKKFSKEIQRSDVLLAPQNRHRKEMLPFEVYGLTSGSGNIFEAIRHSKPIILPSYFPDVSCLGESDIRYKDGDHLATVIQSLAGNKKQLKQITDAAKKR